MITTEQLLRDPADGSFETSGGEPRRLPVIVMGLLALAIVLITRLSGPAVDPELVVEDATPNGLAPATPVAIPTQPPVALLSGEWSPMPAAAISPRTRHTATWTGEEMLVFGGQPDPGPVTGARFDPRIANNGAWLTMATAPLGSRVGHTATWTGSELVVVEGAPVGQVAAVAAQSLDGAAYDPATDTWRPIATAPINPRAGHVAVWTGTEVLVFGGSRVFERNVPAALYNPDTDTWRLSSDAPLDRGFGLAAAVWTGSEAVIWMGTGPQDVAAYDPETDIWRQLPGSPFTMRSVSAVWTGSEMLLLGVPEAGQAQVGGMALDPAQQRWTILPPAPRGFSVTVSAVWTGDSAIVMGGPAEQPGAMWTPELGRWAPLPPSEHPATSGHTAVWTGEELLVWGGQGADRPLGSGAVYRPRS
ncbi:MAG TPA: hypothetical protein VMM13_18545 [Euzebya sp.]|nr:hypothetical protein [Euzebya sp.]